MLRNRRSQTKSESSAVTSDEAPLLSSPAGKPAESCYESCSEINAPKHPYRVFISYSHKDQNLAGRLTKHLRSQGLFPITDHEIRVGEAFSEEIREMIECAHVFMPLVTENANERLWVQQEIGHAAALHVPVCPVAIGDLPSGMAEHIQGIHIADADGKRLTDDGLMDIIEQRLKYEMIDDLVRRARLRPRQGRYDCALYWTDRQELLVTLTEAAYRGGCKLVKNQRRSEDLDRGVWRLRQCTAFGSFSIPNAGVNSPDWFARDQDRYRSQHERRLLRRERQAMETYAKCFGCDLILDPRIVDKKKVDADSTGSNCVTKPIAPGKQDASRDVSEERFRFKYAADRTALRIRLMMEFIKDHMKDDRVRVVIPATPGQITTNLIIVGDWFASEAVVPHIGSYERTMFTRHAPTVLNMIARFNQDFDDYLRGAGFDPDRADTIRRAKAAAMRVLQAWLTRIRKEERLMASLGPGVQSRRQRLRGRPSASRKG
jgi:hypothetical protein